MKTITLIDSVKSKTQQVKRNILILFAFVASFSVNAQIEVYENFEAYSDSSTPPEWTASPNQNDYPNAFVHTYDVCEGEKSLANSLMPDVSFAWIESPMYSGAVNEDITVGFYLKINENGVPANLTVSFMYSTDNGQNWEELADLTNTDLSSQECLSYSYTISNSEFNDSSEIKFRWEFDLPGGGAFSGSRIDEFFVTQTEIPTDPCENYPTPTGESNQTIDEGQTLSDLIVIADDELTWYSDAELTLEVNPEETQPENGDTFYVTQSNDECTSEALAITITVTMGLNKAQMAELKVYPNPANDIINISYKSNIESVTIIDLTGRKVYEQAVNAQETTLNIHSLTNGSYLINIQTTDGTGIVKFIKR